MLATADKAVSPVTAAALLADTQGDRRRASRILATMTAYMPIEITQLYESSATKRPGAAKRPAFGVKPKMRPQTGRINKRLATAGRRTGKRLVSGVQTLVPFQVGRPRKPFCTAFMATGKTSEGHTGSRTCHGRIRDNPVAAAAMAMPSDSGPAARHLATGRPGADPFPGWRVCSLVGEQTLAGRKQPATAVVAATQRWPLDMTTLVPQQMRLAGKALAAIVVTTKEAAPFAVHHQMRIELTLLHKPLATQ